MNTRLQVEHPVTDSQPGSTSWRCKSASPKASPCPSRQEDVRFGGHAIEARLYAEDSARLPAVGRPRRVCAGEREGVAHRRGWRAGDDSPSTTRCWQRSSPRRNARHRAPPLISAIERSVVLGVTTNSDFLVDILGRPDFVAGAATTAFIDENYPRVSGGRRRTTARSRSPRR